MTVWTVVFRESQTPAAPSTLHTIATATMVTMPNAIESRNAVFITDQASTCTSRSWALRGRRFGPDLAGVVAPWRPREVPVAAWPDPSPREESGVTLLAAVCAAAETCSATR